MFCPVVIMAIMYMVGFILMFCTHCNQRSFHSPVILLQGTTHIMDMPINLTVSVPGQVPNWDVLADLVTTAGINIRSLAQVLCVCVCVCA